MFEFDRIKNESFWDVEISELEMVQILTGDDFRKKKFVFDKLLLNSTRLFIDLSIFTKDDLRILLKKLEIPRFNSNYIKRRKNLVEVNFFNADLLIDELKWVV